MLWPLIGGIAAGYIGALVFPGNWLASVCFGLITIALAPWTPSSKHVI